MVVVENLISQIGITLIVSMLFGAVFTKFKQPAILGYLLGGIVLGPLMLGFISQTDTLVLDLFSELGVLMLLFFIGLETDVKKFREGGFVALVLGPAKIVTCFVLGYAAGYLLGFASPIPLFFGLLIAFSSTAIIEKCFFAELKTPTKESRIAIPTLVVQDFIAITMVALVTAYAQQGSLNIIVLNSIFFIVFGLFVVSRLSGYLIKLMEKLDYEKHITLFSLGLALALASLAAYFGLSPAIGAFIGGFMLSGRVADKVKRELATFRDFFAAFFFIGIGLHFTGMSLNTFAIGALLLLLYFVGHILSYTVFGMFLGMKPRFSIKLAGIMSPVGEFSLIIASTAVAFSMPGAEMLMGIAIMLSIASTFIMNPLIRNSERIASFVDKVVPDRMALPFEKIVKSANEMIQEPLEDKRVNESAYIALKRIAFNIILIMAIAYLLIYISLESTNVLIAGVPNYLILFLLGTVLSLRQLTNTAHELRVLIMIILKSSSDEALSKYNKKQQKIIENSVSDIFISFFILIVAVILVFFTNLSWVFEVPAIITAALGLLIIIRGYLRIQAQRKSRKR